MLSRNKIQLLSLLSRRNRKRKRKSRNSNQKPKVKGIFNHGKINLETRRNHRRNGEMNAQKEMSEEELKQQEDLCLEMRKPEEQGGDEQRRSC